MGLEEYREGLEEYGEERNSRPFYKFNPEY